MGSSDFIKFLGTAGARYVVSKQLRFSAGVWCFLDGVNIFIDPGPGTLLRCFATKPKLDPEKLDAVILTHRHLDHSTDMNVLIEAMTHGRLYKRGSVYAPSDAIMPPEPVLYNYLHNSVEKVVTFSEGKSYSINGLEFSTPIRNLHGVETYGLKFFLDYGKIAFISDTLYFPDLVKHYTVDLLIMNVVLRDPVSSKNIFHLDIRSAKRLIEEIRPCAVVMTHFGLNMLKDKPRELAERLSVETGVKVLAAYDDMCIFPGDLMGKG